MYHCRGRHPSAHDGQVGRRRSVRHIQEDSIRAPSQNDARPVAAFAAVGALTQALWHGRSVRAQLLIVFVALDLAAALVAGAVTILQARTSTRVEIAASMELAQLLVSEAVALMRQEVPAEKFLADLTSPLRLLRHVRIVVEDAAGVPLAQHPPAGTEAARDARAPAWFAALIAPPPARREVPATVAGQRIGTVVILAQPRDEIAEVWAHTVALALVALVVNVAVIAMLYVLFGRVLDPLTGIARGFADLEHRNYGVRLARPQAPELAAITDRFNALAQALEEARRENEELARRLITAQDDERRRTALELHDEVGPSLFGLKANAGAIATAAGGLPEAVGGKAVARARDMLAIIEHLQAINRTMLARLRPMALGHVPLRELVSELVRTRAREHAQVAFELTPGRLLPSYGDSVDLTVYRCIQESLTNAIRHADATKVAVALGEGAVGTGAALTLSVEDDGRGIDPAAAPGYGLRGMRERVQGLGGSCIIEGVHGRGTSIRIVIPLRARQEEPGAS
jgi:two-component system sensor histidine kinase UhpB